MSGSSASKAAIAVLEPEERRSLVPPVELFTRLIACLSGRHVARLRVGTAERVGLTWVLAGLVLAAFLADACAPLGVAMWLLHAIPLALSYQTPRIKQPYGFAAASSVLIFFAWFLASPGLSWPIEAFNRAAFVCVLWLAAVWVVRRRTAEEALRYSEAYSMQLSESLERRVCERTAQLEAANAELEAFACSVSHDLRAPLRAVDGFARILEEEHAGELAEEGRRALAVVRNEAQRMGRLISDLLDFSRLGQRPMRLTDVDMTALVQEQFDRLKERAGDREMDFRLGDLPMARTDPALLRQVWFNLLDNAFKYTRHRRRTEIRIDGSKQGTEIVYSIRDNGAGFDMQYAGKLFGMFQRLHATVEFEGTGVGLALVKRIIHRHGGRVWAEAQVGRGATFHFTLPAERSTAC